MTDPKQDKEELTSSYAKYSKIFGLLVQLVIFMLIFTFLGNWVDKHFAHKVPYLTIVGVFIGMAIGFYNLIKNFMREK